MQYVIDSIRKKGVFLLFLILESFSLYLVFQKNIYHKVFFNDLTTEFSGYVNSKVLYIKQFFELSEVNKELQTENSQLRKELYNSEHINFSSNDIKKIQDTILDGHVYRCVPSQVINNTLNSPNNYFTIEKGSKDGIEMGDGVVTKDGVAGIVSYSSDNFSRVLSLLNSDIRINSRIRGNNYFGSLVWDGLDQRYAQLIEIPKYIEVNKGDTIETDGKSPVFPQNIMIGTVYDKKIDHISGELIIQVKLKQNFSKLSKVYVINNVYRQEIEEVEKSDSILKPKNVQ